MRRVIVGEYVSLDGVIEGPNIGDPYEHAGWADAYNSEEAQKVVSDSMSKGDALLLGRVSYESYAAAFSSQTGGFADLMNGLRKYVVSTTLKKTEWNNSTLIKGGDRIAEEIAKLKQQPGKDIGVSGSATLVQTLMHHDLIDEYVLLVCPLVLGSGKRLFSDVGKTSLKLIEAKPLSLGVVVLTYQPDNKDGFK
jgi:dihydrofolate reductase